MTKTGYVQLPQAPGTRLSKTSSTDKNQGTFAARTAQGISNPAFTPSGSSCDHGNVRIVHRAVDVVPEESGHVLPFNYRKIKILVKDKVKKLVGQGGFGKVFRAVQVPPKATVDANGSKKLSRFYMVKDNDSILYCLLKSNEKKCLKKVGDFGYSPWYKRNRLVMHDKGPNLEMLFDLDKKEYDLFPTERQVIPEPLKCSIARQLFQSLQKIHDKGILHSDIKPQNITIDSKGKVSLIDYGIAVKRNRKGQFKPISLTPQFAGPETFGKETATEKTDIWALGITLAEMELGKKVITVKKKQKTLSAYDRIVLKQKPELEELFTEFEFDSSAYARLINKIKQEPGISEDCRNVLLACLELDPDKRPSAEQLLTYPYLRQKKLDEMGQMELHIAHQDAFNALVEAEKAIEKKSKHSPHKLQILNLCWAAIKKKGKHSSDAEMKKLSADLAHCQEKVREIQGLIRKENEKEKNRILEKRRREALLKENVPGSIGTSETQTVVGKIIEQRLVGYSGSIRPLIPETFGHLFR